MELFFFFGPGNQSVLMCAQTSSCHPPGGEKRGEKVFVESRVEAGYGICLLQMCLPCSLSHWGPKAYMRVRHLGFFLGKQFYQRYGRWRIRCCVFTAAGFDCEQQHMLLAGVNISFEHICYKLLHLTCASSVCISLLPHTQKNVCSCLYLSFYSCVS